MFVSDWDYLQILHEGNFISFVCLVLDTDDENTSVVTTQEIRLQVRESNTPAISSRSVQCAHGGDHEFLLCAPADS